MPKKQLPANPMPEWLRDITDTTNFDRKSALEKSVYYPGCGMDGEPLQAYGGFTHSFVYVDYYTEKEKVISQIYKIAGYTPLFIKEVSRHELAPLNLDRVERKPSDYANWRPGRNIEDVIESAKRGINLEVMPYCVWSVMQRKITVNPGHGPERFSLLFIFGEGISTYESIYNWNRIRPLGLILNRADLGFGRNWTVFQQRGSIFERVVKANPTGLPQYLFTSNYQPPRLDFKGGNSEYYWENFTKNIPDRSYLTIWQSDAEPQW